MSSNATGPYPGARPFWRADANRFYGRTAEAAFLAELWLGNRLTVTTGPAACGKTSLLHAGVIPLVTGGRIEVLEPGRFSHGLTFPFAALPEHNPYTLALLRSWSPSEPATSLADLTVHDYVRRQADRHGGVILAPVDQAEELLTDHGPRYAYRWRFLRELAEALQREPRLHLLLLIRPEALALVGEALGAWVRHDLAPLSPEDALQAITGPVADTGWSYADGAAEALVTELRTSRIVSTDGTARYSVEDRVQPVLLQLACERLWMSLPPEPSIITVRDVHRLGNVDAALAAHYGQAIAAVADDFDLPRTRLRKWLLRTFVTEAGTRGTAYEGVADTAGMPNAVAGALRDRQLLSTEQQSGSHWHTLLSDRLIEPLRHAAYQSGPSAEPGDYLTAAERMLALGELDSAERYAGQALRMSADLRIQAKAQSLLGNLAYEREKPRDAENRYRNAAYLFEAVGDTEAVARQLAAAAQTLLAQGRLEDVLNDLQAAVGRMPGDPAIQTELGLVLWRLGHGRTAAQVLSGVLSADQGNREALRARAEILADIDARAAIRDLDRVPLDRPFTRAAHGLALAGLGDYPAANEDFIEAIAEAPRNGLVLLYAAKAAVLGGDKATAAEWASRAIDATDPALPPYHRTVARQIWESCN